MYNFMPEIRKNNNAVLAVEPERTHEHTHGHTHGQTDESGFIDSFPVKRGTQKGSPFLPILLNPPLLLGTWKPFTYPLIFLSLLYGVCIFPCTYASGVGQFLEMSPPPGQFLQKNDPPWGYFRYMLETTRGGEYFYISPHFNIWSPYY